MKSLQATKLNIMKSLCFISYLCLKPKFDFFCDNFAVNLLIQQVITEKQMY